MSRQGKKSNLGCGSRLAALAVGVVCVLLWPLIPGMWAGMPEFSDVGSVAPADYRNDCLSPSEPNFPVGPNEKTKYWAINWENYISEDTARKVDDTLEKLRAVHIAETSVLFMPLEDVKEPVQYAICFTRYRKLGLAEGERKNNGNTIIFLVSKDKRTLDVHYGIGVGLPALTTIHLSDFNRLAEDEYKKTGDLNIALMAIVESYDFYARSKYQPYYMPEQPKEDVESDKDNAVLVLLVLRCVVWVFFLIFVATLITHPFLGLASGVFGSVWALKAMLWPIVIFYYLTRLGLELAASGFASKVGGSSQSSSSGRRGSGGGESIRGN